MHVELISEAADVGNAANGVLYVRAPAPLLRGLSSLAELQGLSREQYVRRLLEGHVAAAAELVGAVQAGEREGVAA